VLRVNSQKSFSSWRLCKHIHPRRQALNKILRTSLERVLKETNQQYIQVKSARLLRIGKSNAARISFFIPGGMLDNTIPDRFNAFQRWMPIAELL